MRRRLAANIPDGGSIGIRVYVYGGLDCRLGPTFPGSNGRRCIRVSVTRAHHSSHRMCCGWGILKVSTAGYRSNFATFVRRGMIFIPALGDPQLYSLGYRDSMLSDRHAPPAASERWKITRPPLQGGPAPGRTFRLLPPTRCLAAIRSAPRRAVPARPRPRFRRRSASGAGPDLAGR